MTRVIGINSEFNASMDHIYSGSSALIENNKIIYALAEERVSKIKHDGGFLESLQEIYQKTGLSKDDIDYFSISFYANAVIPEEDMVKKHLELLDIIDTPEKLIVVPSHHLSHAYLAYFLSPFTSAVIIVADNEGSLLYPRDAAEKNIINNYCERNSYYWAKGNNIVLIGRDFEVPGQVAFGKAYNKFNEYIGFGSYLNAGKTMGLSSYGHEVNQYANLDLWGMDENGGLFSWINETYDSFRDIKVFFKKNGVDVPEISDPHAYDAQEYKDLAYFIQSQLNKWSVKKADYLCRITGIKNLCFSGGVALNSIMNSELENKLNTCVFVPPYPSDPGQALGNAIYGLVMKTDLSNNVTLPKYSVDQFTYLGTSYTNDEILKSIEFINLDNKKYSITSEADICKITAEMLNEGKIIGWFQGRSEYGARALGNRSILANPTTADMRDRVNILKGRELFRPLAPSVMSEYIEEFFVGRISILDRHMLRVMEVKNEKRDKIPAIVHIDGTARLQEVTQESNPLFYNLISEFKKISGIPLVINTSFNAAGDPIVESPLDAIKSFMKMNLDALVCNNIMIKKV